MFGHIDDVDSWVNHFSLIRRMSKVNTNGFTEIVPLAICSHGFPNITYKEKV
jgi:2-iminoacetate synthase ThiH